MKLLLTTIAAVVLVTTAFADPIHDAAKTGDLAGVQAQLDAGVDVNAKGEYGRTPLHLAARGHKEIVELLIVEGADVNAKDKNGFTPLHWAAYDGHKEIAELLIDNGADVNAEDRGGETPLDWANAWSQTETADLLRKHGGKTRKELDAMPPNLVPYVGHLAIEIVGRRSTIGKRYDVEYSNNNQTWKKLETITLVMSPMVYLDKTVVGKPRRFYRIKLAE
jgi:ankyrin repeat protein